MKVGILTFPNSTSYGAVLQMYALYRSVEKLGAQAQIINYQNRYMKNQRHTNAMQKAGPMKAKLRLAAKKLIHARLSRGFRQFEGRMALYPPKPIHDDRGLQTLADHYDCVICGSDQVWNPDITGSDMGYFLNFCGKNTKRIAYAPSFGISEFSQAFKKQIQQTVCSFHSLSAREVEGQQLLRQLTGKQVPLVLDPTFLPEQADWQALEQKHPAAQGEYILYYTVRSSESLLRFARELAKKENKKLVFVGGNGFKQLRNKDDRFCYAWDISPGQWLYLIRHANCVVTNSFHGTAFSIHYQKEFFLELSSLTNSRLEQIVRTAGLEDRVVGPDTRFGPIDYQQVQQRFAEAKKLSEAYLKEAIEA